MDDTKKEKIYNIIDQIAFASILPPIILFLSIVISNFTDKIPSIPINNVTKILLIADMPLSVLGIIWLLIRRNFKEF